MADKNRLIAVAMSGGVDSSVAAAMLVESGEKVVGVMLRLWSDSSRPNRCCSPEDMASARHIASQLDIPFYAIDAQDIFKKHVVDFFIDGYSQGITPNPCIECNRLIRWDFLYRKAISLGATHLATGHYAKVLFSNDKYHLLRGKDISKDQSYVLSVMDQERLAHAAFPLGNKTKLEVRQYAREASLSVADREDSQDLCFVGNGNYLDFLKEMDAPLPSEGRIVDHQNKVLGTHKGLAAYTIGQRKGIGISNPYPLYVLDKDLDTNTLSVGPKEKLGKQEFIVDQINWIQGASPPQHVELQVQIRYKAAEVPTKIQTLSETKALVILDKPIPDVTPGQFAVFYSGQECLGGGIIQS